MLLIEVFAGCSCHPKEGSCLLVRVVVGCDYFSRDRSRISAVRSAAFAGAVQTVRVRASGFLLEAPGQFLAAAVRKLTIAARES